MQRKLTQCFHVLDAVHTLTCALMLLNTDLHGQVGIMLECVSVKLEVCSKCVGAHTINKERELRSPQRPFGLAVRSFFEYKTRFDHHLIWVCRSAC